MRAPEPRFPRPGTSYNSVEESQFRQSVEAALKSLADFLARPLVYTPGTLSAGDEDDYDPGQGARGANTLRFTANASGSRITGLVGGEHGRTMRFVNIGSVALTVAHEDTGSTAANRFTD